jgi:hypothetical protein
MRWRCLRVCRDPSTWVVQGEQVQQLGQQEQEHQGERDQLAGTDTSLCI